MRLRRKDARRDAGARALSETLTQPPADPALETPSETPQEEPFVPDYAPGEEVTDSVRAGSYLYFGALAAQQGRWLYYGVADERAAGSAAAIPMPSSSFRWAERRRTGWS